MTAGSHGERARTVHEHPLERRSLTTVALAQSHYPPHQDHHGEVRPTFLWKHSVGVAEENPPRNRTRGSQGERIRIDDDLDVHAFARGRSNDCAVKRRAAQAPGPQGQGRICWTLRTI